MTEPTSTSIDQGVLAGLVGGLATGDIEIIDLTNKLSPNTPTLTLPEPFANLIDLSLEKVSEFDEPGPLWAHNNIHIGEHIGTHLDAPSHWISGRDGDDVSQIPVERLVGPAVVIDKSAEAAENPDFLLEIEHIQAWEAEHGKLPKGGWLLYRTGWDARAQDEEQFLNFYEGKSHTPGVSAEAAKWLAEETELAGFGVETVGIDAGDGFSLEPPMPVHYYLLGNDKYGVTSLQNLAKLPTTGAVIIVSPLPIVGGTASPARVLAFAPKRA
ncbi:cyclase family protein [Gulosibacter chungangensis]|uniref:Cyclase family protein n=1 Tax=Gulosibacter chungangensis TaxID=979746 RepID=A0A7J5BFZ4_9MICO|nr:cyclase family protein [Gulosibacter chungangensis]KAB1645018.1 cyclase family protein [Gulosibacter chungangensis]